MLPAHAGMIRPTGDVATAGPVLSAHAGMILTAEGPGPLTERTSRIGNMLASSLLVAAVFSLRQLGVYAAHLHLCGVR